MNLVEQITDSMKNRISTVLGNEYKELCYFYDIQKNSFKSNAKRYGVVPASAESVSTVVKAYTLDQEFQVVLTDNYFNKDETDESQRDVVNSLYDKLDEITIDLYASKIGLSSIVFFVTLESIDEPEFVEEDDVAAVRANFIVKYRRNL